MDSSAAPGPKSGKPSRAELVLYRAEVESAMDVVSIRQRGRELASQLGFPAVESALVATAVSELGRNMLRRAGKGEIVLQLVLQDGRRGIAIRAQDAGPLVRQPMQALRDGHFGPGLQGVTRLMDQVETSSDSDRGTTITFTKWLIT